MSEKQILVDGFYCAYRSAFAFKDLTTKDGRKSGLLFGFIRNLIDIYKRWTKAEVVVCWDNAINGGWRREAFTDYKSNRTTKGAADAMQLRAVAHFCKYVGITQAICPGHEADDVIGSLIDKNRQNIIYSRDRDFCQLVIDNIISVYSPKSGNNPAILYTEDIVKEKFGVNPGKLLLYRSLRGDSSDNLPGLVRFPSKKIVELVEKHDDITNLLCNPGVQLTEYQQKALVEFREQGVLNLELMRIRTDLQVRKIFSTFNQEQAYKVLDDFELKSLKNQIQCFDNTESDMLDFFGS